jgi:xanthine dehydrogenase small subunit
VTEARQRVRFVLDGEVVELAELDPSRTVLEVLREDLQRTGTKEGCAEGDCGACTVVLGELDASGDQLAMRAVNACIQLAPTLDGKQLITVESLVGRDRSLHPVQRAMVEHHGSQCGFCTPGIVMSLFALHRSDPRPSRRAVDDALAGNLCRCTGYRPIVDAAQAMASYEVTATPRCGSDEAVKVLLRGLRRDRALRLQHDEGRYYAPISLDELTKIVEQEPDVHVLAGGTDIGLWVTKQHKKLPAVVYLGDIAELREIRRDATHLEIGAAVSLTRAAAAITEQYPELSELFARFASPPIRNAGTLVGNIANGSPIGDSMPALIALDARLTLRRGARTRELPLDAFYLGYRKNALTPGELITAVRVPLRAPGRLVRSYKVSKRFDQDISAVCCGFLLELVEGRVNAIRIAYGGVAATVMRALGAEQALRGAAWTEASVQAAMAALDHDFAPIDDMRASATYRKLIVRNLLYRLFLETSSQAPAPSLYTERRLADG